MKSVFAVLASLALAACCAADPPLPDINPGPAPECSSPDAGALTCPAFNVPCAVISDCCVLLGDAGDCLDVSLHFRCEWCCDPTGQSDVRELSCIPR